MGCLYWNRPFIILMSAFLSITPFVCPSADISLVSHHFNSYTICRCNSSLSQNKCSAKPFSLGILRVWAQIAWNNDIESVTKAALNAHPPSSRNRLASETARGPCLNSCSVTSSGIMLSAALVMANSSAPTVLRTTFLCD